MIFAGSTATSEGGWRRVRHLPPSDSWHPATDSLAGTDQYGNASLDSAAWSVSFGTFDEFLFATGDGQKWLMATKASVVGEIYSDSPRTIMRSSISSAEYQAKWHNRGYPYLEDPWVSLTDHAGAIADGGLLYGENSFNQATHTWTIRSNGGMDVFVRSATGVEREWRGQGGGRG
jgi:hypothetical protein